jgi:8-oxo-dGTP diphosphatase
VAITNDVFPADKKHYVTVWVRARHATKQAEIKSRRELSDVGWFPIDKLPRPLFVPLDNLVAGRSYPPNVFGRGI